MMRLTRYSVHVIVFISVIGMHTVDLNGAAAPSTPKSTPAKRRRLNSVVTQSPQEATVATPNICRECIQSLCDGNVSDFVSLLHKWYIQLPSILFAVNWQVPKMQDRDQYIARFNYQLNMALAHQILLCLANCSKLDLNQGNITLPIINQDRVSVVIGRYTISCYINFLTGKFSKIDVTEDKEINKEIEPIKKNFIKDTFMQFVRQEPIVDAGDRLQQILSYIPVELRVAKEKFYHTVCFGMIKFMGSSLSIPEQYVGKGRSDLIVMSDEGNCIIEFKFGGYGTAKEALNQIKEKDYMAWFGGRRQTVKAIGINISGTQNLDVRILEKNLTYTEPSIASYGNTVSLRF